MASNVCFKIKIWCHKLVITIFSHLHLKKHTQIWPKKRTMAYNHKNTYTHARTHASTHRKTHRSTHIRTHWKNETRKNTPRNERIQTILFFFQNWANVKVKVVKKYIFIFGKTFLQNLGSAVLIGFPICIYIDKKKMSRTKQPNYSIVFTFL